MFLSTSPFFPDKIKMKQVKGVHLLSLESSKKLPHMHLLTSYGRDRVIWLHLGQGVWECGPHKSSRI